VTIIQTTYRNEENGYTVLQTRGGKEYITVVGNLPELSPGEQVVFTGCYIEHPQYGTQWKADSFQILKPTTLLGIERYLASGLIKGVGASTARLIIDHFGLDTLDVMTNEPERLSEIPKIGKKRAKQIADRFMEQELSRQAIVFLQSYGIPIVYAVKITKLYADRAPQIIRENPYRLIDDIDGIGFLTADRIALSLGVAGDNPARVSSAIKYILRDAAQTNGHVFLPEELLISSASRLLRVPAETVEHELASMLLYHELVVSVNENGTKDIYLTYYHHAEAEVARRLAELSLPSTSVPDNFDAVINRFEADQCITLSAMQRTAALIAAQNGVTVITGGPGTGKTTLINCLIRLLKYEDPVLCAPTGRAAKRMADASGMEAKTIHRLLEFNGEAGMFARNRDNPIEAGCLIVDEMSMVDLLLMRALLRATANATRLILVGDADQLPSVGAGNVLGDILSSGEFACVRLTEIYRQGDGSRITHNAHRINRGQTPLINEKDTDFFFEKKQMPLETHKAVINLVCERLPVYLGFSKDTLMDSIIKQIQVLSPMKKGDCGVYTLNSALQEAINPEREDTASLQHGDTVFRVGDKVIQTKNNYQMKWSKSSQDRYEEGQGVFNGDIGVIAEVYEQDRCLDIHFDDDRESTYTAADLEEIELAYCLTVHKSQGSEFPVVILPLVQGPKLLLTRNLLYTALTRAKQMVVLCGREDVMQAMIDNDYISKRYTTLDKRLHEAKGLLT